MTTPELLTSIGVTITGATLLSQIVQFSLNKNTEAKGRQFEIYHRMIKELVEPPEKGATYIDRQCAVVFELRRFKRYRELDHQDTGRVKAGLEGRSQISTSSEG